MNDSIGRLKHYRIEARLGAGGMGAVYRAHDQNLERAVAIKVMHPHLTEQELFQQRFMQEARAAARLSHPSIIQVHDFARERNHLFIVMSFVPGGSLGAYLKQLEQKAGAVQLDEILYLLAQVADALDYAHGKGVVHRDVKPDNILLRQLDRPEREGEPPLRAVVTDFGLAKLLEGGVHTVTGTFMGTLPYMSPEQALGEDLDGRSDLYSLGVILYQLATGQLPFDITTPTDAVRKHMQETPPPPRTIRPQLPDAIAGIIEKALAKKPAQRYQSGRAMAQALRAVAAQLTEEDVTRFAPPHTVMSLMTELRAKPEKTPARPTEMLPSLSTAGAALIVARKGMTPRSYPLDRPQLTVGRSQDNDVVLDQQGISRRHARLDQAAGGWQIVDLGSTNGTYLEGNKLLPDVPEAWEPGQTLHIGAYYLQWRVAGEEDKRLSRATSSFQRGSGDAPSGATQMYSRISQLNVVLNPTQLTVAPGEEAAIQVQLSNQGTQVAHYHLRLEGVPERWISMPRDTVRLMPGDEAALPVRIHPPRHSSARAGPHEFQLHVTASEETGDVVVDGVLDVSHFSDVSVDVHPTHLNHGDRTRVEVHNQGNREVTVSLRGRDPAAEIRFEGAQELRVPPGETESSELTVAAIQRPWFGRKVTRPFHIEVAAGEQRHTEPGQLDVPPRLPTILVLLLLPLLCLGTGAIVVWAIEPQLGLVGNNNGGRPAVGVTQEITTAAPPAATTPSTLTPTAPGPTTTPTPTRNPGIGRFETTFNDQDTVFVAFGPTLGGQHVCAYHNLSLGQQDVDKTLTFRADDIAANPPGDSVLIDVVSAHLYRSLVGAVDGADEDVLLDLWDQPNVEDVLGPASPFAGIEWEVTRSGDYILCLQVPVNTFFAEDGNFDGAIYTVLLSGG